MKLSELQKKIADVLGVSDSQKELSFDIFIDKISEILLDQLTLKVPRIGFFQLKADWAKGGNPPLIYAPLSEDFLKDSRNLYLTIDASKKIKPAAEIDSTIFSIGVGKPLLPLSGDELPDSETSYAMLKKSIEERVKEIIMESDQIPNFSIWDDYYNSPENMNTDSAVGAKNQLSELTADLDFSSEIIPDKIPDNILEVLDFNFEKEKAPPKESTEVFLDIKDLSDKTGTGDDYLIVGQEKFSLDDDEKKIPSAGIKETILNPEIETDYSALENLQYGDEPENKLTLSELMDDLVPPAVDSIDEIEKESGVDTNLLPTDELLGKILEAEKKKKTESPDELPEEKSSENISQAFEEFHKLNSETKSEIEQMDLLQNEVVPENKIAPEIEPSVPAADSSSSTEDDALTEGSRLTVGKDSDTINPDEEVELGASNNDEEETGESGLPSNIDTDITKLGAEEEWGVTENSGEKPETEETEDHDEFSDESGKEEETDKVEWNWGDELREEFGIPPEEEVDARYEMVDNSESPERNEIELVDEFLDEETTRKDLFRQLEKTLERELKTEKKPGLEFTSGDKKLALTSDRDTLKKVILEFSGPPSKYEFVEDRPAEKEKRMAITLINETSAKTSGPAYNTEEEISGRDKNNYSKNLIIISAVMLVLLAVAAAVIFFIDRSSKKDDTAGKPPRTETSTAAEQSLNSPAESQQLTDNGASIANEEMSDFPRTATPPVPIKDATDRQILETIKKETAKFETSGKESSIQSGTQKKPVTGNPELYKNATSETKINNRIFYDGKNFNLQISSWPNRARAEEEVNRLRGDGFNAFIVEANLPQKGGLWFRVRIGPFKSEKEANEFLTKNNF